MSVFNFFFKYFNHSVSANCYNKNHRNILSQTVCMNIMIIFIMQIDRLFQSPKQQVILSN